jgi:hypothetical protein
MYLSSISLPLSPLTQQLSYSYLALLKHQYCTSHYQLRESLIRQHFGSVWINDTLSIPKWLSQLHLDTHVFKRVLAWKYMWINTKLRQSFWNDGSSTWSYRSLHDPELDYFGHVDKYRSKCTVMQKMPCVDVNLDGVTNMWQTSSACMWSQEIGTHITLIT